MAIDTFRIKDLMINVIPSAFVGGGGSSQPGPDDDMNDIPWWLTPVISIAVQTSKFQAIRKVGLENLAAVEMEHVAHDLGFAALGGAFLCSQDMPTCAQNPRISPWATPGVALRFDDLPEVKLLLNEALEYITKIENSRFQQAQADASTLIPLLEDALRELRR
jgi:hypothetical protein